MTDKIAAALLVIVGIVNVIPVTVFFDPGKTAKLYGVSISDENLVLLTRHRGVLLAIVGVALIFAAFKPELRFVAVMLAFVSKFTFIYLTFTAVSQTPEIRRVALIDVGAIIILTIAIILHFVGR